MNGSGSPTCGKLEGAEYNRYLGEECYHFLFCFNRFGDLEGAMLRCGSVHNADE